MSRVWRSSKFLERFRAWLLKLDSIKTALTAILQTSTLFIQYLRSWLVSTLDAAQVSSPPASTMQPREAEYG